MVLRRRGQGEGEQGCAGEGRENAVSHDGLLKRNAWARMGSAMNGRQAATVRGGPGSGAVVWPTGRA